MGLRSLVGHILVGIVEAVAVGVMFGIERLPGLPQGLVVAVGTG